MSWVDFHYLKMFQNSLQEFHDLGKNTYNFRCPYCGDSKKNTHKRRGFIYEKAENTFYHCYNCGVARSFSVFLKEQAPHLWPAYRLECMRYRNTHSVSSPVTENPRDEKSTQRFAFPSISEFPEITEYAEARKLPQRLIQTLGGTLNINQLLEENGASTDFRYPTGPAIIIPYRNPDLGLEFIQLRYLIPKIMRYCLIPVRKDPRKIWGRDLEKTKGPVWLFEGVFDACYFENAWSCAGTGMQQAIRLLHSESRTPVIVLDNEVTSDMLKKQLSVFRAGLKSVIFPSDFKWKDINQAVCAGISVTDIDSLIRESISEGLTLRARISQKFRKVIQSNEASKR